MKHVRRHDRLPLRFALAALLATGAGAAPQWLSEPMFVPASPSLEFGRAALMDGDLLLVGSRSGGSGAPASAGAVHVMHRTPGWSLTRVLTAEDPSANARLGHSVALDGSVVIAGAPFTSEGGAVYAFLLDTGEQLMKLVPSDVAPGDRFGTSVAFEGVHILAGAPKQAVGAELEAGAVYVIKSDGSPVGKLNASDADEGDEFGSAVAISATAVLVGAPKAGVVQQGAAYVFDRATWSEQQKLVASGIPTSFDGFGRSVAIDGDTLLVCSRDAGFVFVRQGSTWVQEARLSPGWPDNVDAGMVGALSGDRVILGLPRDAELGSNSGSAAVFVRSGSTWTLEDRMLAPDGEPFDSFGSAVALSGARAAVLAPFAEAAPDPDRGALYPYELDAHPTFCHGAALAACPCGNAGASDAGCDNPQATGGVRAEFTAVDRAASTASLVATGFPPGGEPTAIVIRSSSLEAVPQPFFDGVRCITTSGLVRMAASTASSGVSRHEVRHLTTPGTYHYQVWYRSPPAFCTHAPSNVSSGDSLTW